jgi:hypothetical protein
MAGTWWSAAQDKPAAPAKSGEKGKGTTKAEKSRGEGEDPNIKSNEIKNDPANLPKAPGRKGGDKSRGDCWVHVDNRTGYYINIYIDGYMRGTVSPWGDVYGGAGEGGTTLYASAPGTGLTWGPNRFYCYNNEYTWTLTD